MENIKITNNLLNDLSTIRINKFLEGERIYSTITIWHSKKINNQIDLEYSFIDFLDCKEFTQLEIYY